MSDQRIRMLEQHVAQLERRIMNMLVRGTFQIRDDEGLQYATMRAMKGEKPTRLEYAEPYGWTSAPHAGAEALAGFLGGARDNGLALQIFDRRYRLKGLVGGEVAIHDDQDQKVHIKRAGVWVDTPKKVVAIAPKVLIGEDNDGLPRVLTEAGPSSVLKAKV